MTKTVINRLVSIWDWRSLDENLHARKSSKFSCTIHSWEVVDAVVWYGNWEYHILWRSERYKTKQEVRDILAKWLVKEARLVDTDQFWVDLKEISINWDNTSDISSQKPKQKYTREDMKKKFNEERQKVVDRLEFWSNPKVQAAPIWVWAVWLFAWTLLSWWLGFWAIILWWAVMFLWGNYIWDKIDRDRIKLEKLKKIEF